ncbi:MAG: D-alanine--D-alanine ligase, partial [Bifidobacterium mongoliense]|nr:D-alanine--D-alanine ligase [Bifidobacterium mongoliense]
MTDDSKVASAATHDAGKPDATSPAATTPSTTSPSVSASLDPKHMAMRTSAQERKATDVLIVCGGLSHEREISVRSGHRVGGFLEEAGWTVHFHDMDSTLLDYLSDPSTRPDIVW